ncbi:MAG TPA: hypothetical protein DCM62_02380 [Bacteroidales bacterium]|nr:hypothetical protein [Bacteroidales bacterium]
MGYFLIKELVHIPFKAICKSVSLQSFLSSVQVDRLSSFKFSLQNPKPARTKYIYPFLSEVTLNKNLHL